ncbi:MAG: helix-turn-helix domain-containing protein [Planctomycetota bacterium]|jgi:excisionase family DNA binding protein
MEPTDKQFVLSSAVLPEGTEQLLVDAKQAASMLSIGKTHFYAMLSSGRIGPMAHKLGRRSLFSVQELRQWVSAGMPSRQKWMERKKAL